jgi:hypothetical protein
MNEYNELAKSLIKEQEESVSRTILMCWRKDLRQEKESKQIADFFKRYFE